MEEWMNCVRTMHKWYIDNFGPFYDFNHGKDESKLMPCDLIDDKLVRADCSGYVIAALVLFGDLSDTLRYNVTHGSFNFSKKRNDVNYYGFMPDIRYLRNDLKSFDHIYVKETTKIRTGDILYNDFHVIICDDNFAYEWGSSVEHRDLKKYDGRIRMDHILDPYKKIQTYFGLWRLKDNL